MQTPRKENVTDFAKWMSCPKLDSKFPGLAYICTLNELIVVKEKDALHELISKKGTEYTIFNKEGQKVFLAVQEKHCRQFDLKIFNYYGNEVIQVKRPLTFCVNRVLVWAPPGNFIGSVKKVRSCFNTFLVKNRSGETVLKIRAAGLFHFVYEVILNDEEIGAVAKNWKMATVVNMKNFGVSFPITMDVEDKAILLGACFLIGCLKY